MTSNPNGFLIKDMLILLCVSGALTAGLLSSIQPTFFSLQNNIQTTHIFSHLHQCQQHAVSYKTNCWLEETSSGLIQTSSIEKKQINTHSNIKISNRNKKIGFTPFGTAAYAGSLTLTLPQKTIRLSVPVGRSRILKYEN